MFDALIAEEVELAEGGVLLRCGPIIYMVECAQRDGERLTSQDLPLTVSCKMELSDETATLVGFSSIERRKLYRGLRAVGGIGRRSALLVLDCGEVIDTLRAVAGQDISYFRGVPGLGQARIEAIIRELEKRYRSALPTPLPLPVLLWVEARDALLLEGIEVHVAEQMLRAALEGAARTPRSAEALLATVVRDNA